MILPPGSTSVSVTVFVADDAGAPVTGLVAATFPATYYSRIAEANVAIALSDLAAVTSSYSSGGVKEKGNGEYRLDVPDAAFATADNEVRITGEASGKHIIFRPVQVGYPQTNLIQMIGQTQLVTALGVLASNYYTSGVLNANLNGRILGGSVDGFTMEEALRVMLAALAGKLSGAATTQVTIRDVADVKDRVVATVDAEGNRSAVTIDGSV